MSGYGQYGAGQPQQAQQRAPGTPQQLQQQYRQQQQQQQLSLQQQQRAQQHHAAQQQQQRMQQQPQAQTTESAQVGDGNDGLRAAKRRKPTDRSIPSFVPKPSAAPLEGTTVDRLAQSTEALQSMARSYGRLQQVERKLDWAVSRRRVEMGDSLTGHRLASASATLRVHMVVTLLDQPWQVALADVTAPLASDAPATASASLSLAAGDIPIDGAAPGIKTDVDIEMEALLAKPLPPAGPTDESPKVNAPDFKTGAGVPRFELKVTGELLATILPEPKEFLHYVQRIVVETDRDAALYAHTAASVWTNSSKTTSFSGVALSFPSSVPTKIRISLYLKHAVEIYNLAPELAALLDLQEADRVTCLQAMWGYIKMHGLQDDDKKSIRPDARMKPLFAGQEKIPFHHLPEYLNRFLTPAHPVVINYLVQVDPSTETVIHKAYDTNVTLDDPLRNAIEKVMRVLNSSDERVKVISDLDDKIALEATAIKTSHLKRSFLNSFCTSPATFLSQWISSQATDLSLILGHDRGSASTIGGGPDWREGVRRSEVWKGEWVREGAGGWSAREGERELREVVGRAQLLQQQQQQQQQMQQQQMGRR